MKKYNLYNIVQRQNVLVFVHYSDILSSIPGISIQGTQSRNCQSGCSFSGNVLEMFLLFCFSFFLIKKIFVDKSKKILIGIQNNLEQRKKAKEADNTCPGLSESGEQQWIAEKSKTTVRIAGYKKFEQLRLEVNEREKTQTFRQGRR